MYALLGWVLLAGTPLTSPSTTSLTEPPRASRAAARVAVWTDRDDPYRRGEAARVYLSAEEPGHVAVFRVDTDGRIRVLFPREPWDDTWVAEKDEVEIAGRRGRSFMVDDDPGIGYLFALASPERFDFDLIARGDHWDYRALDGGRITGDPYLALTDLAARLVGDNDYDYDISPYYVEQRYDFPRFVCYDCHAYAAYDEWDPYRRACARFRVVIYDDPRYYPYRAGRGRNVVIQRSLRPEPRYVFRDADPKHEYVTRVPTSRGGEYRQRRPTGRTSRDVGGQGTVPAPNVSPRLGADPDEAEEPGRRRTRTDSPPGTPRGLTPSGEARPDPLVRRRERPPATTREPQSTGEPELRRRKP
jgi:hypothetical protein